ncbi:hypothetical protein [Candidatus Protochlamydia phocaeensis]|uniref:hypothetical protein n=1 Tax=Candidatus Protochlamydia phocaeensis TaxID=1414722 RepID=UPI0012AC469E|nr:hypothetical protein [Candidatus Protochlamydia phocaeensis]
MVKLLPPLSGYIHQLACQSRTERRQKFSFLRMLCGYFLAYSGYKMITTEYAECNEGKNRQTSKSFSN